MTHDIKRLAERQLQDYDARTPGTLFASHPSLSNQQAYAIQSEICRLREQRGENIIGYKIGCTSPAIQQQLGIDTPVFGRLFSSECYQSGITLPMNRFANLAIEGELAVRLSADLPSGSGDHDQILSSISSVVPVIELHNHVFRSTAGAASELIANNALQAGFVKPNQSPSFPPTDELSLQITLAGTKVAEVASFRWRDVVVQAIGSLSSLLVSHGLSLRANHWVLTGSLAELISVTAATKAEVLAPDYVSVAATFQAS